MLVTIAQFLLSLSILVVLHEFGHFLPAKWFKTRVEKFYLFFDPYFSLFKKQIGETEWGIGWLPLGGYVKISGMIDESFDADQMKGEPQPWEFRSKPAWQRLIIMLGGVTVNFLLGFLIFAMIFFTWGKSYTPNASITEGIYVDSIGMALGLQDGDKLVKVGDEPVLKFSSSPVVKGIVFNDAKTITVMRNGQETTLQVPEAATQMLTSYDNQKAEILGPRVLTQLALVDKGSVAEQIGLKVNDKLLRINGKDVTYYHQFNKELETVKGSKASLTYLSGNDTIQTNFLVEAGKPLGILPQFPDPIYEKFGFFESLGMGVGHSVKFLKNQVSAFGKMFSGKIKAKDSLGSFITIGKQFGTTWDWMRFWNMTGMLSLILGFLNLLPIPALDGGHVMFLLWEVVTGRKPSDKVLEYATMAGFALLVVFMVYALGLDIMRNI